MKTVFSGSVNGVDYNDIESFHKAYDEALKNSESFEAHCSTQNIIEPVFNGGAKFDFDAAELIELAQHADCRVVDKIEELYDELDDIGIDDIKHELFDKESLIDKAKKGLGLVADRKQFCKSELVEVKNQIAALETTAHNIQTELSNLDYVAGFFDNIAEFDEEPIQWAARPESNLKSAFAELEEGLTKMISDLFKK